MASASVIEYEFYSDSGERLYRDCYYPTSDADFFRVMKILEAHPEKYKGISVHYTFVNSKEG